MIKVRKIPLKYSFVFKIESSGFNNHYDLKYLIKIKSKELSKIPKNTIKIIEYYAEIGRHGDDFIKDLISIKINYLLYTFKR